ncbi:hypothetical protein IQ268_22970 [Oculatella sp. LEGE 06141]|uniref:hypothetical protein n=1 Tax=Oculatella sp. LEGE 06141 TaxID=1828648 RepID=UPI001881B5DF|nr:hypothetical protein [Oculatella sp. LEGE 06141]MBE9181429.1 hypothetical protein [Oculatella sp. LEGE 06141]
MNLTAGTALQDGKYIVQATLGLTDLGVTLQATHAYLDQTVILHTLNPSLRDRPQFANLHQQFMVAMKQIGKRQPALPSKVVDCFEEGGLPFLVLERLSGQPALLVEDWFTPTAATNAKSAVNPTPAAEKPPTVAKPVVLPPFATNGAGHASLANTTSASPNGTIIQTQTILQHNTQPVQRQDMHPLAQLQAAAATSPPPSNPSRSQFSWQVPTRSQVKRRRSKRWLPFALMVTAAVATLGGVSFGLSLRFGQAVSSPSPSVPEANPTGSSAPSASPTAPSPMPPGADGLFGSSQEFLPSDNWPGTSIVDTDQITPPSDMPIERSPAHEPIRRRSSVGSYEPPPEERLPQSFPSDGPSIQEPPSEEPALAEEVPPFESIPDPNVAPVPEPIPSNSDAPTFDFEQLKPIPPSSEPSLPTESSSSPKAPAPASNPATIAPLPDAGAVN